MIEISPQEMEEAGLLAPGKKCSPQERAEKLKEYAYLLGDDLSEELFHPAIKAVQLRKRREITLEVFRRIGEN